MGFIRNHFRRYFRRSPSAFCWWIGIESTVVSLAAGVLLALFGAPERDLSSLSFEQFAVLAIIVAPIVETLAMQAFPIFVARKLKASFAVQTVVSTLVFALFHLGEGVATFLAAGILGGFYFSFAYAYWRRKGRWPAYLVTAGAHAIHNAIAIGLMALQGA